MTSARRALRNAAVSLVAAGWAAAALAAGGGLDPSFSRDGWVRTLEARSATNSYLPRGGEGVALQRDGKILVTGELLDATSRSYFGVSVYTRDGSLDRAFAGEASRRSTSARPSSLGIARQTSTTIQKSPAKPVISNLKRFETFRSCRAASACLSETTLAEE